MDIYCLQSAIATQQRKPGYTLPYLALLTPIRIIDINGPVINSLVSQLRLQSGATRYAGVHVIRQASHKHRMGYLVHNNNSGVPQECDDE